MPNDRYLLFVVENRGTFYIEYPMLKQIRGQIILVFLLVPPSLKLRNMPN